MEQNSSSSGARPRRDFVPIVFATLVALIALTAFAHGLLSESARESMCESCSIAFLLLSAAVFLLVRRGKVPAARSLAIGSGALVAAWGVLVVTGLVGHEGALLDIGHRVPLGIGAGFLLLGLAACFISSGGALFHVAQISALLAGAEGVASILSRFFRVPVDTGWPGFSGAAPEADLAQIIAATAILALRNDRGLGQLLLDDGLGSRLARPLVAASLLLPALLLQISGLGHARGLYGDPVEQTLDALMISGISGAIVLLASAWIERSDRKRRAAVAALAASEERLELQMRRMPIACIVWSPSFRVMSWNAAATRIFGFGEEEMVGREPYGTILPASFESQAGELWKRLLEGDENANSVNENTTKDGRTIVCEWSNTPLRGKDGAVDSVVSMVADVTAKLEAERSLRESEERYRDLVESSSDLICTHDLKGRLLSVNAAATRSLGIPMERLLRMRIQDIVERRYRGRFASYMATITAEGEASGTMTVNDASGALRVWEYRNTMRYRHGEPWLVRGVARDVTERSVAESALRESEARYRMLFENGPHPSFVVDEETVRMAAVNGAALRAFGLSEKEFLSKSILSEDLTEDAGSIAEARKDPSAMRQRSNLRFRRSDGSRFVGDALSSAIEFNGRAARLVVITDVTEREEAKNALLEVQQFQQEIISGAGQGIVVTDRDLRIMVWNPFMEQLTGIASGDAIGNDVAGFCFLQNRCERAMRETLRSGRRQTSEIEIESGPDRRWLLGVYVPHRSASSEVSGVIAIVSDITEQKQSQEQLRLSRELHRNIIDSSPNFVYSYDLDGRFLSANHPLCAAIGLSEDEMVGKLDREVGFPEERIREWDLLRERVVTSGERVSFSTAVPLQDGQLHTYDVVLSPLRGPAGAVNGTSGIAVDVTDRRRKADTITRLSQAVAHSSDVIFMTDRDGAITYANPAFEAVYGYTLLETLGKTPRLIRSGLYSAVNDADLWRRILRGETVRGEWINKRKDGSLVTVERSVSPVYGDDGEITGFISVQNDVTERRAMHQEQEKLRTRMAEIGKMEALGTLAGGIAHDFNNILSIVLSFSTLAERVRLDAARFPQAIATIRQAVSRGADLAKQILTFARRADRPLGPVDLNDTVREIERMARETFPKTIAVETQLDKSLPLIAGDASGLHQALLNLAVNARDAMPGGGTITITTARFSGSEARILFPDAPDQPYALIEVADTGTGISEEARHRIFEPFFTTKSEGRGTGLGLAVTYGVVNAAGGFIGVESAVDRGATFYLLIPLPEVTRDQERPPELDAAPAFGTETVLLVEDEPTIGPFLVESLEEHGYTVLFARDGAEALRLFERNAERVQLVVSDDGLPLLAGRDVLLEIRKRESSIPLVLASGFIEPGALDELRRAGLSHFLQKPYDVRDLLSVVRTLLDAPVPLRPELQGKRFRAAAAADPGAHTSPPRSHPE